MKRIAFLAVLAACVGTASGQVRITEWMYQGANGEFIEITNVAGASIDLSNYSFDDDSRTAGTVSLSSLGSLGSGESAIITEATETDFRTAWGLSSTTKILGGNTTNLGRNDEINIFDGLTLVDRLTYGDVNIGGSIRTNGASGNAGLLDLGTNDVLNWSLSAVPDAYLSWTSAGNDIGNPGVYAPVPEPASFIVLAGLGMSRLRRRR